VLATALGDGGVLVVGLRAGSARGRGGRCRRSAVGVVLHGEAIAHYSVGRARRKTTPEPKVGFRYSVVEDTEGGRWRGEGRRMERYLKPVRVDRADGVQKVLVELNPPERGAAVQPVARL